MADMKTIINGFHKVKLAVLNIGSGEEAAFAVNELIQPNAVILSMPTKQPQPAGRLIRAPRQGNLSMAKDRSVMCLRVEKLWNSTKTPSALLGVRKLEGLKEKRGPVTQGGTRK